MLKVKISEKASRFLKCSVCALSLILGMVQVSDVYGNDGNKTYEGPVSNGGNGEENNDSENYPFEKAQGTVADDQVCGLRIKEEKTILLGVDHTFSELSQKNEGDFGDINFFRKYPNLMSVEFSNIELTDDAIQNLQTFLPENLKMIIIDSCKISKKGYALLAKLLKSRKEIVSIRIRMYSANADQSATIIDSLGELKNLKYLGLGFGKISEKSLGTLGEYIGQLKDLKDISLSWMGITEDDDSDSNDKDDNDDQRKNSNEYDQFLSGFSLIASSLTGIEFAFIELPEKVSEDLFTELDKCRDVNKLTLWVGNMNKYERAATNECAKRLGDALTNMKSLTNLDISCMGLETSFMKTFANCYEIGDALTALNISGNTLEADAAAPLGESLKNATNLQVLLANDCKMENQALGDLFKNLGNSALKCICLSNNKLKDGIKQLPIKNMTDLQGIDLSNNEMGSEEILYISENAPDNLKIVKCNNNKGLKEMKRAELTDLIDKLEQKNMEGQTVGFLGI